MVKAGDSSNEKLMILQNYPIIFIRRRIEVLPEMCFGDTVLRALKNFEWYSTYVLLNFLGHEL